MMYSTIAFCAQAARLPLRQGTRILPSSITSRRQRKSLVSLATPQAATESSILDQSATTAPAKVPRILSGVQPTGNLHLGNYLGAVRLWVDGQNSSESYLSIVDMHAITVGRAPELRQQTLRAAAMYLACGIDPKRSTIFVQSQVGAHAELMWLLSCVTPHGWLNRMIQFKEKAKKHGESASMGLFAYPVLQAADVLLYRPDIVPVGEDQRQHIELARDIAKRFNDIYCAGKENPTFKEPELRMVKGVARVMGLDGATVKMSKSAENDGSRINLTDTPDVIRRKIKRCKTDSFKGLEFDNPERPECDNLLTIYQAVTGKSREEVALECADYNWGKFKPLLADALVEHLDPIRIKYDELMKDKTYLADVLEKGYEKANEQATRTMDRAKKDVGFLTSANLRKIKSR